MCNLQCPPVSLYCLFLRILSLLSVKEETPDCLLRAVCEANEDSSLAGEVAKDAVEVGTFILLSRLPLETSVITDMVLAARVGRVNYGITLG